jgi:hypothetical protein
MGRGPLRRLVRHARSSYNRFINIVADAVRELEKDYSGAFGPGGGKCRAIAIAGTAVTLGTCVGPVVGRALNDESGYYAMNCVVGK